MEDYKSLLVAQFIIINQVFGDGNHRAALFVLNHYSKYSPEIITRIMSVTDRIHKWDGDLKHTKIWIDQHRSTFEYYLPDLKKINNLVSKYILT